MSINEFLKNNPLKEIVSSLSIDEEKKEELLKKIPHLSKEERIELLRVAKDIFLLEIEKEEVIEEIKNKS